MFANENPAAKTGFEELVEAFDGQPDVTRGVMFGAPGLRLGKKYFAVLMNDRLVVKLPQARIASLLVAGEGDRFEPMGRTMKEWVAVAPDSAARWPELAGEAKAFVGGE